MPYDFDEPIERRSHDSIKWTFYPEDVLPLWVADMDFRSPRAVTEALRAKVEHAVYGYELPTERLIDTVCQHLYRLYGWEVAPRQVVVLPGLVTGINVVCRAVGEAGEGVLMTTPVYHPFLSAPRNNGLVAQFAPLAQRSHGPTFSYEIDFEALESAAARSRLFLFCHPHNPIGHSYSRDEMERLVEACARHDLLICSDEIHAELTLGQQTHTPLVAAVPEAADRTITLIAPSKTFNTAGLGCGFAIAQNPELLERLRRASEGIVPHVNSLGLAAAEAALRDDPDTRAWLVALRRYLTANRDALVAFVSESLPGISTTVPDSTYLAWLDCRAANLPLDPYEYFLQHAKVGLNDGATFGENGQGFVRLNFGCPRSSLLEALERMRRSIKPT